MRERSDLPLSRSAVDRDAYLREDPEALTRVWQADGTRVLLVDDAKTLVDAGAENLVTVAADEAPEGETFFLGHADGHAYFAVRGELPEPADGTRAAGLREIGTSLGDTDVGLAVHAIALERWHSAHQFCPRCGAPTEVVQGGSQRDCTEDGSSHFPRVDPAVIMLVYDDDGRCLLARQHVWPERRYSVLAGFVEPGESLERAVVREVAEEVNVLVDDVSYVASQPWPFPASLMLGFTARAVGGELKVDDHEITDARWFTRDELAAQAAAREVLLPHRVSIARMLVEDWYGGPLDGSWT